MDDIPWEPPLAGTETEHVAGALDRLRWTFRWKVDGLDRDGLAFRLPSSALSLGGLLKHLARVEDEKFSWVLFGERPQPRPQPPEGVDAEEWEFTVTPDDTAEDLYRLWDEAVERSRAQLARVFAEGGLDRPAHASFGESHPSMRRFVMDLIEEYGRHTGHADLIREALDGRVGEDPPPDWYPGQGPSAAG